MNTTNFPLAVWMSLILSTYMSHLWMRQLLVNPAPSQPQSSLPNPAVYQSADPGLREMPSEFPNGAIVGGSGRDIWLGWSPTWCQSGPHWSRLRAPFLSHEIQASWCISTMDPPLSILISGHSIPWNSTNTQVGYFNGQKANMVLPSVSLMHTHQRKGIKEER